MKGEICVKANGVFSINKWDEQTLEQLTDTTKTTKASVESSISGEIEGSASVEYLMFYKYADPGDPHKSSAVYIGLTRISASMNGKQGSFIFEDRGTFENGNASSSLQIIPGSGTGGFKNISGTGKYSADSNGAVIEFEYNV